MEYNLLVTTTFNPNNSNSLQNILENSKDKIYPKDITINIKNISKTSFPGTYIGAINLTYGKQNTTIECINNTDKPLIPKLSSQETWSYLLSNIQQVDEYLLLNLSLFGISDSKIYMHKLSNAGKIEKILDQCEWSNIYFSNDFSSNDMNNKSTNFEGELEKRWTWSLGVSTFSLIISCFALLFSLGIINLPQKQMQPIRAVAQEKNTSSASTNTLPGLTLQTSKNNSNEIPSIKPKQASTYKSNQVPSIKPKQASTYKPNQVPSIKPKQASTYKSNQVPSIKPKQASTYKSNQVPSIKPKQASTYKSNQVPSIKPKQASTYKPSQISKEGKISLENSNLAESRYGILYNFRSVACKAYFKHKQYLKA
ncbi:energy transducer TonB [Acaryochloris marina]|uniref:Uncharacterized protein n=1 Tax=Acaryochloris marina (strain MBIC 11017) TaxID=329726 RepID=A8ZMY6_ACAM1|nr:hypothetical protein [Acaryochloris marina]ABW32185.1 hypothetical protein AM1_C0255 [Acaryochloris marina MBIC11017]